MLRSVYKWSVFWIFQDLDLRHLNPSSPILKCLVSDSLLYVKGLLLLEDLPLPKFPALGIYFYSTKGNRIVSSKCVVVVVN